MTYDYCVIGGGIVWLATAMALLDERPDSSLVLLDKERFGRASDWPQQRRDSCWDLLRSRQFEGGPLPPWSGGDQELLQAALDPLLSLWKDGRRDKPYRTPSHEPSFRKSKDK